MNVFRTVSRRDLSCFFFSVLTLKNKVCSGDNVYYTVTYFNAAVHKWLSRGVPESERETELQSSREATRLLCRFS